jgi:glycosyltransferase involved in cell wall biosynthesis
MDNLKKEEYKYFAQNKNYLYDGLRSAARASLRFVNRKISFKYRNEKLRENHELHDLQNKILQNVDAILPNSIMEKELLLRDFPCTRSKYSYIIFNCIDIEIFNSVGISKRWGVTRGLNQFVLCVGRLEPRKNQLRLVQVMRKTNIPIVMVGRRMNMQYYKGIKDAMKATDVLIEETDQQQLKQIYAAARVHVLPSIYDTPGLASLEAGAMGCNIVTSDIGSQREYFGDMVDYCNPYDHASIYRAIEKACQREWPNECLQKHIRENYTWQVAAKQTLKAYTRVVKSHDKRLLS